MDIAAGLAGLNTALETLKTLRGIEKAYDQAVLKAKIVDLMGHVADAKIALIEARETHSYLQAEIASLTEKLKAKAALVEFEGQYYTADAEGKPTGTPFCPACLAKDGTQIRYNPVLHAWVCPRCKATASRLRIFAS